MPLLWVVLFENVKVERQAEKKNDPRIIPLLRTVEGGAEVIGTLHIERSDEDQFSAKVREDFAVFAALLAKCLAEANNIQYTSPPENDAEGKK